MRFFSSSRFRLRECVYLFLFLCDTQKKERKKESICAHAFETFPPRLRRQVRSLLILYSYFLFLFFCGENGQNEGRSFGTPYADGSKLARSEGPGQIGSLSTVAPSTCQIELKGGLREVAAS